MTRRFVPSLPTGTLFGRVRSKINEQWYSSDFTFSVTANTVSGEAQITSAMWATDVVRQMALTDNRPFSWTLLAQTASRLTAHCTDFASALLAVLAEMNLQLPAKFLGIALNPNSYDAHTLVEMFDPARQNWLLLDPTFDLTVRRTSDGNFATAEDMSAATRALLWSDVSYEFLGARGDEYARGYYLDYPLLFVNIYHAGQVATNGQGGTVLPYMVSLPAPVLSAPGLYATGCAGGLRTNLSVDGVNTSIDCSGVDGFSYVFAATSIEPTAETSPLTMIYRPMRFVF